MLRTIALCTLLIQLFQRSHSTTHKYQHLKDNIRAAGNGSLGTLQSDNNDNGFMMCAGNHMVPDVLKMIWQLKHQWRSEYGISVAHCGEITEENQEVLRLMHPGIRILNMCSSHTVFGMAQKQAHYRLRGFYCKVAAMIMSPFPNTMLVDLDVLWFQSPDLLFKSRAYIDTGALFFRDRTYPVNHNHKTDEQILLEFFNEKDVGLDKAEIHRLAEANGGSFYWKFIAAKQHEGEPFPQLSDLQDSSVVLLNREKHPNMLKVMEEMLPSFEYGYGDKEIFWIAATVAKEPFTFSPFLAGQYGDCHGMIMHYNPDDVDTKESALPLYTSVQFKDLRNVGDGASERLTPPRLAKDILTVGADMHSWTTDSSQGAPTCTCKAYPCAAVPSGVTEHVLYAQWLSLSMRLSRAGPAKDCVPVKVSAYQHLSSAFSSQLKGEHCFFVGCPQLPVKIDTALSWLSGRYCDPVHFLSSAPAEMKELAIEARRPNSAYNMPPTKDNTPIQCDTDKQLLLYIDGTARPFNSWNAFVGKGFDLDNVVRIPRWQCDNIPRGAPIN